MKRILRYFDNYKIKSILSPLFKLSEAAFELTVPLVIADIIDNGIPSGDSSFIVKRVLLLFCFAVVGFISAICAQYFAAVAASGISGDIRHDLFGKVQSIPVPEYEKIGSSKLVTGLTSDVNQIQSGINLFLRLLLRSPFIVIGAVIMAFTISARMALIFVAAVALLGIVVALNMKVAIPAYQKTREGLDKLAAHADNGLKGVRVIRGFNRTKDDCNDFKQESLNLYICQKAAAKISSYLNPFTFFIINSAIILLIYRGGVNVSLGRLTSGQVVALYNYMSQILVELIKLANLIITVSRAAACWGRVTKILDMPVDDHFGNVVFENPEEPHSVEFRNVCFRYEESHEDLIEDVSLKIEPGQTVGVIGKTGSGKSTLAALVAGMYPATSGQVLIDGRPVSDYSHSSITRAVGLCLQKAVMYTGSIIYNISLWRDHVDKEKLDEACRVSLADDVISSKKEGLYYNISSNGSGLSGGQKQRLGIARTLAGRPGLLVFDDSTSALDAVTERKFLNNLDSIDNKPTIILISQKIRTVKNCDMIILLEDGRISDMGSHEQLCGRSPVYRELLALQEEGGVS